MNKVHDIDCETGSWDGVSRNCKCNERKIKRELTACQKHLREADTKNGKLFASYEECETKLLTACEERDRAMTDAATFAAKWHDEEKRADEAIKERDRFRKDSEALDWLMEKFGYTINGIMKLAGKSSYSDCPEHLRKRLEGMR